MKAQNCFLCFLFIIPVLLISSEETVHVVQRGETIYAIARSYGVKVEDVLSVNNMADSDVRRIQVGQRIRIPVGERPSAPAAPAVPAASFIEHRVLWGETFYGIARANGVPLQTLKDINGFPENYVLKEGDLLRIPMTAREAAGDVPVPSAATVTGSVPVQPGGGSPVTVTGTRSTEARKVDDAVRWPVNAREVSYMTGKLNGVVLRGNRAESVKNLIPGTVVSAGPYRGFGKVAILQVTGGYLYVYGGCESLSVKVGDKVMPGMEIGKLGIDAISEKPQLFFMVYRNNIPIDPAQAPRA
jgi:murein DD-endopeptidase MepM/ murein hydrolase activator NlpD